MENLLLSNPNITLNASIHNTNLDPIYIKKQLPNSSRLI